MPIISRGEAPTPADRVARDAPGARQVVTILPRKRFGILNVGELWSFRTLLVRFAARDITLRYRQTALGVIWVVLQPLLGAGVLTFVFGSVANLPSPLGIPYFVFSLVGTVAFNLFSGVVTRASSVLVTNAQLVSKVYFPRLLLPLSTVISAMLDFGVSAILVAALLAITGTSVPLSVVLFPVWILLLLALGLGISLGGGALMVRYRDVQYTLPLVTQLLLYASPVAYTLSDVPRQSRALYELNPLTGLLEGIRWSTFGTARPPLLLFLYAASIALLALAAGLLVFGFTERQFADVI